VHLCQKVPFVRACFQASAAPRPENSDSHKKHALFALDTQITMYFKTDVRTIFVLNEYENFGIGALMI
jgi:hypothetical protein